MEQQTVKGPLRQVAEFMYTMGQPVLESPTIPSEERCDLRVSLLVEESKELDDAAKNKDIVKVADALCDLQYVLTGAVHEFGLGDYMKELFDEVHRSNMSKACQSEQEAQATVEKYASEGTESYIKKKDDYWLVYRKSDDKLLKSINYSPADLEGILRRHNVL